jgi:thioesterase domain-containing protein/acyl carrier protein
MRETMSSFADQLLSQQSSWDQNQDTPHQLGEDRAGCSSIDQIEQDIARIWKQALSVEQIQVQDNFFDLGGDSMLAVETLEVLEDLFDRDLSLASIFEAPTIQQLAQKIKACSSSAWYSLAPLQPKGSQPILFGVHVLEYRSLCQHLGSDQPVYGLRYGIAQESIEHVPDLPRQIEVIAAHYIQEMRSLQPQGPYFLMGFSLGGRIALEMAQQLVTSGQSVGSLIIFDTYFSRRLQRNSFKQTISMLLELELSEIISRTRAALFPRVQPSPTGTYKAYQAHPMGETHFFEPYLPKPYPGKVLLFQAHDRERGVFRSREGPEVLWKSIALEGLEVHEMPGGHGAMLTEPYVQQLAQILKQSLSHSDQARV